METKLKLISKRIHWSLALKAGGVAAAWYFLPRWAFLFVVLYFYFVPIFHPWKLFLPFLTFLFLVFNEFVVPAGQSQLSQIGFAAIIAVFFYVILGIKDLVLIDRRSAYDGLVLALI